MASWDITSLRGHGIRIQFEQCERSYDIFSRLLKDGIVFHGTEV